MTAVKLSICIPTYNREAFLRKALERAEEYKFNFSFEIVISDNASTDGTAQVVADFVQRGLPIRYFRREINGGSAPNLACAFRQAIGEYSIYLADDDILIADAVGEAIEYLDNNPDVTACHAPWYLYDEIRDKDTSQFYHVENNVKFAKGTFAELFKFIFDGHIFPEIAIYRTSILRFAWVPRDFCFWAFSYLAHFLDQGAITFLKRPFYRSVTASTIQQDRQQAGHQDVMTAWDKYRGGLEYFLYIGVKRNKIKTTPEARAVLDEMCKIFTLNRMAVAIRFWAARKDYIKAYELYTRLALGGLSEHPEVVKLRNTFPLMVGVQTLAWQINATAGIDRLVLSGVADLSWLEDLLRKLGLEAEVQVMMEPSEHHLYQVKRSAVFVAESFERERFIALGYAPNLVFCEADLIGQILV